MSNNVTMTQEELQALMDKVRAESADKDNESILKIGMYNASYYVGKAVKCIKESSVVEGFKQGLHGGKV